MGRKLHYLYRGEMIHLSTTTTNCLVSLTSTGRKQPTSIGKVKHKKKARGHGGILGKGLYLTNGPWL